LNFQDCIKFAKENPTCAIATVEKDQARVRFVEVWRVDDSGFYFQTESSKAFCKQLKRNPKMEVDCTPMIGQKGLGEVGGIGH
jgi:pyridoxamine 5'-phosphate oxidase